MAVETKKLTDREAVEKSGLLKDETGSLVRLARSLGFTTIPDDDGTTGVGKEMRTMFYSAMRGLGGALGGYKMSKDATPAMLAQLGKIGAKGLADHVRRAAETAISGIGAGVTLAD